MSASWDCEVLLAVRKGAKADGNWGAAKLQTDTVAATTQTQLRRKTLRMRWFIDENWN
jgi:hypothetical protein